MAGEIPEGLTIEKVWAVEATYGPDAADRRPAVRSEHLARIAELRAAGTIVEAGAYTDMSGSVVLLRAASEEEALALVRADVYFRSGVWTDFRVRAFGRVARLDELAPARQRLPHGTIRGG
jgi:uncharacterized protein YciI